MLTDLETSIWWCLLQIPFNYL